MTKDYMPLSAIYATEQASYDFGVTVYEEGETAAEVEEDIRKRLTESISSYLQDPYLKNVATDGCSHSYSDFEVFLSDNQGQQENTSVTVKSKDPTEPIVTTDCSDSNVRVRYSSQENAVSDEVWGNRVLKMIRDTGSVINEMNLVSGQINYIGDGEVTTECRELTPATAKGAAANKANETMETEINQREANIIEEAGESEAENPDDGPLRVLDEFGEGAGNGLDRMTRGLVINQEYVENETSVFNKEAESCPCTGFQNPVPGEDSCWKGKADYEWKLIQTAVDIGYIDRKYKIPVSSGWKKLSLNNTYVVEVGIPTD